MPKKVKNFGTIGSFEEFISRRFNTLVISHCKTENIETAGPLFSQPMVEFLMSRLNHGQAGLKVIVIGKKASLNQVWENQFANKNAEIIER